MGIEAITQTDDGKSVIPSSQKDWLDWVSATSTRNFLLQDPISDWLKLYGEANGFQRDQDVDGYDPKTDFTQFIFKMGNAFEAAVVSHLKTLTTIVDMGEAYKNARRREKAEETFTAMERGDPVIYQGILWNAENRTYGSPDLLVRSDVLARLFPDTLTAEEATQPAKDLKGAAWHYRVVDIKFTTLHFTARGELGNGRSTPAYKAQVFIYNLALGRIQGYAPPVSYLLGRSWEQRENGEPIRGNTCMERLAPVNQNSNLSKGRPLGEAVIEALEWVRRVRKEGATWSVLPKPTLPELRPNMKHTQDAPWSVAKKRIAKELEELTLLWNVGIDKRRRANQHGIYSWRDTNCNTVSLGVNGEKTQPVLQAMLDINQSNDGPPIRPSRVKSGQSEWRDVPPLELYVDFETVSDINDDFSQIPKRGGQPLIFMIGCGHIEKEKWYFESFTADSLTMEAEANIIDAWIAHMKEVRERLDLNEANPSVIHWSHAETSTLRDAYNSAVKRHPKRSMNWSEPNWFDFLKLVMKAEPVVVRGAFGFGLKAVAGAMYEHGFIETKWEDGSVDGLGAMVGAWWCADEAKRLNVSLKKVELMKSIVRYNEIDCKVMMEIVRYLRKNH